MIAGTGAGGTGETPFMLQPRQNADDGIMGPPAPVLQQALAGKVNIWKKYFKSIVDMFKDANGEIDKVGLGMHIADMALEAIGAAFDAFSNISTQYYRNEEAKLQLYGDKRTTEITEQHNTELAAVEERYNKGLIDKTEYDAAISEIDLATTERKTALDEELARKKNALAKKAFIADKANNIASVMMGLANSIMSIWARWAALPPVAGALTGIVSGMAAAQVGLIGAQKFVPAAERGTSYAQGGLTLVGEQGPELADIPRGSRIIPNNITGQVFDRLDNNDRSGGGVVVNVNNPVVRDELDIDKIANAVSRKVARDLRTA
jgi:hypothetical protein